MNTIVVEGIITRISIYQDAFSIQFFDDMFEKKNRFTTRIIGPEYEKWKEQLREGDFIKLRGNIAEAKSGYCGSYMVVYNPVILDAYKTKLERIKPEKITI